MVLDPRGCVISRWTMKAYSSPGPSLLSEIFHSPVLGTRTLSMRLISSRGPEADAEHHDGKLRQHNKMGEPVELETVSWVSALSLVE